MCIRDRPVTCSTLMERITGRNIYFYNGYSSNAYNLSLIHIFPILGNGDITTPQRAKECFDLYGVAAIMIGRASFGRPWFFKAVKHYLETGEELPPPSSDWRLNVLRQEVEDSVNLLDERRGIPVSYTHLTPSGRQITFNLSPLSIFRIEDNPHGLRQLIRHPFPIQFNLYSCLLYTSRCV